MDFKTILERGLWMELPDAQLLEKTARETNPKVILEIGGAIGASSMILGHVVRDNDGHLYTIEQNPHPEWNNNMEEFGLDNYATLMPGFSPWIMDFYLFYRDNIDYLFIDGSHETRSILMDYYFWEVFVRKGGRIAFHDYTNKDAKEKVQKAINIILETDTHLTKVAEVSSRWGLIVFEKNKDKFDFKPIK